MRIRGPATSGNATPRPRPGGHQWITRLCLLAACTLASIALPRPAAAATPTSSQLTAWGQEVYQKAVSSLQVPGGNGLFAETASTNGTQSGGDSGFSYVWPASTQMRVYDVLTAIDPKTYQPVLRNYSDQVFNRYWTANGGGYRSGVSAGAAQFYDDNAHMAVALAQAYQFTGDATFLNRAVATYNFVLSGEDDSAASGGGGIYYSTDRSFKDSAATLQGARAGLLLYQITGQSKYLTDAQRLYTWEKTHLQESDGLFEEKYYVTGPNAGTVSTTTLVNFTGMGISDNIQFYRITHDSAYLSEAERIAGRALTRFFDSSSGAIQDEGFWAFELVNALDDLSAADKNSLWYQKTLAAMQWLHDNARDPNGHYGTLWGRGGNITASPLASWNLNDQAAVADAYLYTATVPEPGAGALLALASAALLCRRRSRNAVRCGQVMSSAKKGVAAPAS